MTDEVLDRLHNLVASVILLEKQNDDVKLKVAINKIIDYLVDEDIIDIKTFSVWLSKMFKTPLIAEEVQKIKSLTEGKPMLSELVDKIRSDAFITGQNVAREEGLLAGLTQGEQRGVHKKALETAKNMLADGFNVKIISK